MDEINLMLPYPPTINHYYERRKNGQLYIGIKGRAYRLKVKLECFDQLKLLDVAYYEHERLSISIDAYPPDHRKRDLDNICKCLLDSLQNALVFRNDDQIDKLLIERNNVVKNGKLVVKLEVL